MNRDVTAALRLALQGDLSLRKSRLESFCVLVVGVLLSRTVNLSHLACMFPTRAAIASNGADGVDAPQRPWCARVEVLNTTRGRRLWVRLARSVWIWRRASSRFTEPMPQERLCSASGCGGARFARSWRPSPPAQSPWRPAA